MESLIIILAGVLVMIATYLFLSKNLIRIILGSAILSHAAHLLLMAMGGLKEGSSPLLGEEAKEYTDAIPQALILTAIVINFAVTAIFLVIAYRTYQKSGTDNLDALRGLKDE
ncbi:MAG TPA: Na(+)/H(+) antiporter subunit C [Candidatus Avamphibacillus sp.]|nr:Na(+)/H(+) antiporter subunit C [Candidatus Avamphibacillus sp.]